MSLAALVHLLSTTTSQRVERARDAVREAVAALARDPENHQQYAPASLIGMRGGVWRGTRDTPEAPDLPAGWRAALQQANARAGSAAQHAASAAIEELHVGDGTLVLAVQPSATVGTRAWAGFLVRPPPSLRTWQEIVGLLAMVTVLLVATSVYSIVTMHRGAAGLHASLEALAADLSSSVPRPPIRELSDIADGIAHLAQSLALARKQEERLSREVTQNERLTALGRVVAGVAHEVRNPLASIKLRLDLAATSTQLPAAVEQAIAHASSEIARLDRLVADLLIVAGRAAGPLREVSLGELWRDRATALSPWAQERGVSITCAGDARAVVDVDSLARAIDNLLRNAVEASPRGATVAVRFVDRVSDLHVSQVRVLIEDYGTGVANERERELFEPFFTTKPDGTGLGLAISRAIARAHGGDLTYRRADGVTRFELTLSRAKPQAQERAA